MIVYENSLKDFKTDVITNTITNNILDKFKQLGYNKSNQEKEIRSWQNSMNFMNNLLSDSNNFSDDVHVAIEYSIPNTKNRIDFMLFGEDEEEKKNFVVIELKQWTKAKDSGKQEIVVTNVGKANNEIHHPSYQAKEYLYLLNIYNEYINKKNVNGAGLSYLHNADIKDNLNLKNQEIYKSVVECPIYFKNDYQELKEQLKRLVGKGKGREILFSIENSKIVASKKLVDAVKDLFEGNQEYMLVDSQKDVFENIMAYANDSNHIFIVNGNPGTGKSVVALNLLIELIKKRKVTNFVTPNASFRECIVEQIKKLKKGDEFYYKHLFKGSSNFVNSNKDDIDWIIVDEAHRLKDKAYMYSGKNQIEDIIKAAKNVVFFVDEKQAIRNNDIGTNENIIDIANAMNKTIHHNEKFELSTQFRCSGADGYINALDTVLQIEETANRILNDNKNYEFKIVDNPFELEKLIKEKIDNGFKKSKILAGYAWKWNTKKFDRDTLYLDIDKNYDIHIVDEENDIDYKAVWNKSGDTKWALTDEFNKEIGCVHTTQGLEFDYCGVIIGNDLKIDDNNKIYCDEKNYFDIEGKKGLKDNNEKLTKFVKNIYKVLLSRGQLGTFVYICDKKLREYFKKFIVEKEKE